MSRPPSNVTGDTQLTASDVVYLFGDSFVGKVVSPGWLSKGVVLESTRMMVDPDALAEVMIQAAIASLLAAGCIELSVVPKQGLISRSEVPTIGLAKEQACVSGGLEGAILDELSRWEQGVPVGKLISRVTGRGRKIPSSIVFSYARRHLLEIGLFHWAGNPSKNRLWRVVREAKRSLKIAFDDWDNLLEPQTEVIGQLSSGAAWVKRVVDSANVTHGQTWVLLVRQVGKSLARGDGNYRFSD